MREGDRSRGFAFVSLTEAQAAALGLGSPGAPSLHMMLDGRRVEVKRAVPRDEMTGNPVVPAATAPKARIAVTPAPVAIASSAASAARSSASVSASQGVSAAPQRDPIDSRAPRKPTTTQSSVTPMSVGSTKASSVTSGSVTTLGSARSADTSAAVAHRKIFVGGLMHNVDDPVLKTYFSRYGRIASAQVMYNRETNRSRGFGFVIFEDGERGGEAAVDAVLADGTFHVIDGTGKQVEIKRAVPKSGSSLPSSTSSVAATTPASQPPKPAATAKPVAVPVPPPVPSAWTGRNRGTLAEKLRQQESASATTTSTGGAAPAAMPTVPEPTEGASAELSTAAEDDGASDEHGDMRSATGHTAYDGSASDTIAARIRTVSGTSETFASTALSDTTGRSRGATAESAQSLQLPLKLQQLGAGAAGLGARSQLLPTHSLPMLSAVDTSPAVSADFNSFLLSGGSHGNTDPADFGLSSLSLATAPLTSPRTDELGSPFRRHASSLSDSSQGRSSLHTEPLPSGLGEFHNMDSPALSALHSQQLSGSTATSRTSSLGLQLGSAAPQPFAGAPIMAATSPAEASLIMGLLGPAALGLQDGSTADLLSLGRQSVEAASIFPRPSNFTSPGATSDLFPLPLSKHSMGVQDPRLGAIGPATLPAGPGHGFGPTWPLASNSGGLLAHAQAHMAAAAQAAAAHALQQMLMQQPPHMAPPGSVGAAANSAPWAAQQRAPGMPPQQPSGPQQQIPYGMWR